MEDNFSTDKGGEMVSGWFKSGTIYYASTDLTGGGAQMVMWGGPVVKYRQSFACSPDAHLLLRGTVHAATDQYRSMAQGLRTPGLPHQIFPPTPYIRTYARFILEILSKSTLSC